MLARLDYPYSMPFQACSFDNQIFLGALNDTHCPSGYSIKVSNKCHRPGYNQATCKRDCCFGWEGSDCKTRMILSLFFVCKPYLKAFFALLASCSSGCVNGNCISPNNCSCNAHSHGISCNICDDGWTGAECMTPICLSGCQHGSCTIPNTCVCDPRWNGTKCEVCANGWSTPAKLCTIGLLLKLRLIFHFRLVLEEKKKTSFGRIFYFLRFSFAATCKTGCVNGGCNYPGECYCNPGYSGPTCASQTIASGINSCSFPNVTSPCNLANGQLLHDCPSGYSRIIAEACPDIPGFDRNICGKTCCDGWTGADCLTRLLA